MSKQIKQAESREIMRSQMSFAYYNPRKISEDARKRLKANLKRIGLAGGIVWNENTGNIVSGHQRLAILDEIQRYNPQTQEGDYQIRVDVLHLTDKEEKEQNVAFNSTTMQGEWDNDLLAKLIPEIDIDLAGLDASDLNIIMAESPAFDATDYSLGVRTDFQRMDTLSDAEREARKEHVKAVRAETFRGMEEEAYEGDAFVTLSFQSYQNKLYFMELVAQLRPDLQLAPADRYIKGEAVHELLER